MPTYFKVLMTHRKYFLLTLVIYVIIKWYFSFYPKLPVWQYFVNCKHISASKKSTKYMILNYDLFNHSFISFSKNFWETAAIFTCTTLKYPTINYGFNYKSKFPQ